MYAFDLACSDQIAYGNLLCHVIASGQKEQLYWPQCILRRDCC